ncbi:MAG: 3-isopropylmalate dehydratase small subunit [Candidatus Hydrothermarchaeaceae archaeon]
MKDSIKGRVWRFGANVDTDQIIPAEYLVTGDPIELGRHSFERARPNFAKEVRLGDIIVADENFGCGSSREHAPRALIGNGMACVIAKSFARIFFRNSINIGLPVIECPVKAKDGDELYVDFSEGKIKNITSGEEFEFGPLPDFLRNMLESGGLVEYTKRRLAPPDGPKP